MGKNWEDFTGVYSRLTSIQVPVLIRVTTVFLSIISLKQVDRYKSLYKVNINIPRKVVGQKRLVEHQYCSFSYMRMGPKFQFLLYCNI